MALHSPRVRRAWSRNISSIKSAHKARRAGYAAKTAKSVETQAARLLANVGVRAAIDAALQKCAEKYPVTAEKVIPQLARIALANPRDYVDEAGEALDLRKLTDDLRGTGLGPCRGDLRDLGG
jgi:phage terminase small subunit